MRISFWIHLAALLLAQLSFANIKTVTPKDDEILQVKTSLGIATIIQMPEAISSAIIGDQSAYRIEYVDKAVTIKPLRAGAKTNLYLLTAKQRYNLHLVTVAQDEAYYIFYVKERGTGELETWKPVSKVAVGKVFTFKILRIGTTADGFLLFDIKVTSNTFAKIEASDFWVKQSGVSRPINSLFLSESSIRSGQAVTIGIALKKEDLQNKSLSVSFLNRRESLSIEFTKGAL